MPEPGRAARRVRGTRNVRSIEEMAGWHDESRVGVGTASRDFTEFLAEILTEHMGSKRGKLERCLFVHESNETRVVFHVDDPLICAKPATLEKFWTQIMKLVVIKRGEALNPRVPVTYLGFEYRSVHGHWPRRGWKMMDGFRRGKTVPTIFSHPEKQLRVVVHGDDFTFTMAEPDRS